MDKLVYNLFPNEREGYMRQTIYGWPTISSGEKLRIPPETEFKGVDICEHGEAAYPVDAWVELQYSHTADNERPNVPRNMQGTHKYVMAIETRSGMHLCMHAGRSKWPKNDGVTISWLD
jgi:hypothetical protein